jgi:hypothetical protein
MNIKPRESCANTAVYILSTSPDRIMKKYLALALMAATPALAAETIQYHCDGMSTSSMGSVAKREEADSKHYLFEDGKTGFYNEIVNCDISETTIRCRSDKFNRTLEIDRPSGNVSDLYEILKNGQPHVKIEFNGICRPDQG